MDLLEKLDKEITEQTKNGRKYICRCKGFRTIRI